MHCTLGCYFAKLRQISIDGNRPMHVSSPNPLETRIGDFASTENNARLTAENGVFQDQSGIPGE
jgi:hypothetical protein